MRKLATILIFLLVSIAYSDDGDAKDSLNNLINTQALKFKYILETARDYHVDSLAFLEITDEVLKELLQKFDKQSAYFTAKEVELLKENNTGKTFSIGIDIQSIRDTITIINIAENSPAQKKGLMLGDKILAINGSDYKDKTINYIKSELNGDSASKINLKIYRKFGNLNEFSVDMQRLDVETPSVTANLMYDNLKLGYIKINRFSELADNEFEAAAKDLLAKKMKYLIVDLRGNPGGSFDAASNIADFFLPAGKKISYTESKSDAFKIEKISTDADYLKDIPLVILIDENSASGSELIAAAIQDYDRGIILGERSYGKGSIQKVWYLVDGSAFKLTVGEYFSPVGRELQKPLEKELKLDETADLSLDSAAKSKIIQEMQKFGTMKLPTYQSQSGRTILGGGGVWPDEFAKADTMTTLTKVLIIKGVFNEFAIRYKAEHSNEIQQKYGDDFMKFTNEFEITDEILQKFANLSIKEFNIWNKEMFEADKLTILFHIKASIAHFFWGNNGYTSTMLLNDKIFKSAIQNLPKAENIIKKN